MERDNPRLRILLVDDSLEDAYLFRHCVKRASQPATHIHVDDGTRAQLYLAGEPPYEDPARFPLPDLVVTDLKMPRVDGLELLAWVRAQPEIKAMPVIILSSSGLEADIARAYRLGVTTYFEKPPTVTELQRVVNLICDYWAVCRRPGLQPKDALRRAA